MYDLQGRRERSPWTWPQQITWCWKADRCYQKYFKTQLDSTRRRGHLRFLNRNVCTWAVGLAIWIKVSTEKATSTRKFYEAVWVSLIKYEKGVETKMKICLGFNPKFLIKSFFKKPFALSFSSLQNYYLTSALGGRGYVVGLPIILQSFPSLGLPFLTVRTSLKLYPGFVAWRL